MTKYQKILEYISYFENVSYDEACHWGGGEESGDGTITMGYPIYSRELKSFIYEVYKTDLFDINYGGTLEEYRLPMSHQLAGAIDTADIELTKAILTCYIRQERFCEGLWGEAVKNRVFLKLLLRLRQLLLEIILKMK